jgi:hypothetical protein
MFTIHIEVLVDGFIVLVTFQDEKGFFTGVKPRHFPRGAYDIDGTLLRTEFQDDQITPPGYEFGEITRQELP